MLATLHVEDYLCQTLDQLTRALQSAQKTRAGDITLRELAATLERPNGVYAFYDQANAGTCLYVGKVSSQSYIARIAMHFDPREKSWMNQFVRKLRDAEFAEKYDKAHTSGLEQYIVFLGFLYAETGDDSEKKLRTRRINTLESILRTHMSPRLNPRKGSHDGSTLVSTLLSTEAT